MPIFNSLVHFLQKLLTLSIFLVPGEPSDVTRHLVLNFFLV